MNLAEIRKLAIHLLMLLAWLTLVWTPEISVRDAGIVIVSMLACMYDLILTKLELMESSLKGAIANSKTLQSPDPPSKKEGA